MYFFIEYDRELKELIKIEEIESQEEAWKKCLAREKVLFKSGKLYTEVVVFKSKDRKTLEATHSRYFKNFDGVLRRYSANKSDIRRSLKKITSSLNKFDNRKGLPNHTTT